MSDTVTVPVSYRTFPVPEHAFIDVPPLPKQDGMQPLPKIPITELPPAALDALAAQWLDHLFATANRASPFTTIAP